VQTTDVQPAANSGANCRRPTDRLCGKWCWVYFLCPFTVGEERTLFSRQNVTSALQREINFFYLYAISGVVYILPIPVAVQSKAWVSGHSLAGIAGSNPAGSWMYVPCEGCVLSGRSLVKVVCCQVEVFATGRSRRVLSTVCMCVSLSVIHTPYCMRHSTSWDVKPVLS
jgi:hypothetical protein